MNHTNPTPGEPELPPLARRFLDRVERDEATVAVIGLGYVGLPLSHCLHGGGLRVLGLDVDGRKIRDLESGTPYLAHIGRETFADLARSERFQATTDFAALSDADAVISCVPTPLGPHQEPDLSFVLDTARGIGERLRRGQLLVLESTTYPGTTRDEFLPAALRAAGQAIEVGAELFAAFSPEREDPGRKTHTTRTIPKLVGGLDPVSTRLAAALYRKGFATVVEVESAEIAEAAKLLENVFRSVNIAMVNEMKMILDEMGIDVWKVIDAAATKPFGFMPFYPGPGLGGHCIPIDPFYLSWKAREIGRPTRFIELAGEVNRQVTEHVVQKVLLGLNEGGRAVRGSRILILGLAYKKDVDDTRESPSFELLERLRGLGAEVDYSDPHIPRTPPKREYDLRLESRELDPDALASYDAVVVATDHSAFDYELIAEHARLIVDTRNAFASRGVCPRGRLIKA